MDYTDFKSSDKKGSSSEISKPEKSVRANLRWWEMKGAECAQSIHDVLHTMDRAQMNRVASLITSSRLYGGGASSSSAGLSYSRFIAASPVMKERLSYNLVQSCIDTAVAKIGKNQPKPYSLTSGGDYKTQRKAKKLNQYVEGIFYEQKAYEKRALALRDAAVNGDGLIYVHERHGRVVFDRVLCSEMWIDDMEAFYGSPRQMHRVVDVDRDVLMDAFRGQREQIADASNAPQQDLRAPTVSDAIRVAESWHLPSGPEAKDGMHAISIEGVVLLTEPWKHDFFPFARWQWSPRMYGYWCQGAAEQLAPTQIELNKLLGVIQRAHQLSGSFVIFLENSSKVVKAHLDNEIGRIVNYSGVKPAYETPPVCPPELYQQVENLIKRGYDLVGISELSAQGQKPAGLNSGKALREMDDIGSDRFTTITKADERAVMELGRLAIVVARDIAQDNGGHYEVTVPGKRFLATIDWKKIDLDDDAYTMQCFPVSSLPSDPAGRLQTVQEYIQAGFIAPEVGQKLLEFPDLQQFESLQNAMEDRLQQVFDGIVDDGEYLAPQPHWDLKRAKALVLQYTVQGESQGLDEDRLGMLADFNSALDAMAQAAQDAANAQMQQQAMAQQMANAPPGGSPPAVPNAPPTSDLLPNGAQAAA